MARDPGQGPHPQVPTYVKAWLTGRKSWGSLTATQRTWIRRNIVDLVGSHPELFEAYSVTGDMRSNQIIRIVNQAPKIDPETGGVEGGEYGPPSATSNDDGGKGDKKDDKKNDDKKNDNQANRGKNRGLPAGYRLVKFGGRAYVVYDVKLAGGGRISLGWSLSKKEAQELGINWDNIKGITREQFKKLSLGWGSASELVTKGLKGEHPLQTYLRTKIYQVYGKKVSWVKDKEVLEIYLMAYLEGWTTEEIYERLKRTDWWRNRTDAQRNWELEVSKADKRKQIELIQTRLRNDIMDLYGPTFEWADIGITNSELNKLAEEIASGKHGDPEMGYELVFDDLRREAEQVEGSQAWIDLQQDMQAQRDFMNEPENMLWDITQQAIQWLGPQSDGVAYLSEGTLQKWANDLVSGTASEADWNAFLQQTAKNMYPWLPANTTWTEAVDPYRALAERVWGKPVPYEDAILQKVAAVDPNGTATGGMMDFLSFEKLLRMDDAFWTGEQGHDEGWSFLSKLDNIFHGVV